MRLAQALDVLVPVAGEPDADLVVAVEREGVRQQGPAPGAEGHAGQVPLLGQVRPGADGHAAGPEAGAPDREPGDPLGRPDVPLQQRRREVPDGDVVEPEARRVAREQGGHVDVEGQQVAHRVVVLGAVEPPERLGAPRVGGRRGVAVQGRLERADGRRVRRLVGPAGGDRGHLAGAQLADHPLPDLGVVGQRRAGDGVEGEPAGAGAAVVARQAVALDHRPVRIRLGLGPGSRRGGGQAGEAGGAQHSRETRAESPSSTWSRFKHPAFSRLAPRPGHRRPGAATAAPAVRTASAESGSGTGVTSLMVPLYTEIGRSACRGGESAL